MKTIFKNKNKVCQLMLSVMMLASITILTGCEDPAKDLIPGTDTQLATPKDLSGKVRGTTITVVWRGNIETKVYEVEFTRTDNSEVIKLEVEKNEAIFEALKVETEYVARVRAVAVNSQYNSDWASYTFVTGQENIMRAKPKELLDLSITVTWTPELEVTHIVVYPEANPDDKKTYSISESEKASGEKILDELIPETLYEVELYNGENLRGSAGYTTIPLIYPALDVTLSNITPVSITLSWLLEEPVTYFVLSPTNVIGETLFSVSGVDSLLVENLMPGTEYRIEAFKDNSKRGVTTFTANALEDCILTAVPAPTSVTVKWTPADPYMTRISYNNNTIYTLTEADITAGEATITTLTPLTEYTFKLQTIIGNKTFERGQVTAKTQEPPKPKARYMPTDGSGSIQDSMVVCISGDTLVLAAGKIYEWTTNSYAWIADKSLTVMGANATNRSVLSVSVEIGRAHV